MPSAKFRRLRPFRRRGKSQQSGPRNVGIIRRDGAGRGGERIQWPSMQEISVAPTVSPTVSVGGKEDRKTDPDA